MDEPAEPRTERRYLWPWFAFAGVVAGIVLAILWMTVAVQRTRESRGGLIDPLSNNANAAATVDSGGQNSGGTTNGLTTDDLLYGGNAEAGRKIFFEKPEANCAKCHTVDGVGTAEQGPPLDGIGAKQTRQYLLDSLLKPNLHTVEGYETINLILKNGSGCFGLLKAENINELHVLTAEDGLIKINKQDVDVRQKGLSPMPEGLDQLLSKQDLRDLIEFMASLKD